MDQATLDASLKGLIEQIASYDSQVAFFLHQLYAGHKSWNEFSEEQKAYVRDHLTKAINRIQESISLKFLDRYF